MSTIRTAHRQFGSKARVASELIRLMPADARIWVEGFAGTASVTLAKTPHLVEHINDLNGDVANLFRVMRNDAQLELLCRQVNLTPYAQEEFEACREVVWSSDADHADDPVERARRFLVATWQGIGGRQHVKANWRLDMGKSWMATTWHGVPMRLERTAARLKHTIIHRRHIFDLVKMFGDCPEALLFLDPPYPRETLATHEQVYSVDMDPAEHAQLADMLAQVQCRVILTMAPGTIYQERLSPGMTRHSW